MFAESRHRLTHYILRATILLANYLGILPFRYNKINKRVECSKFLINYTIINNAITIILLYFWLPRQDHLNAALLQRKPIVALVNSLNIYGTIYVVIIVLWRNWRGRRNLLDFFNECLAMDRAYFQRYNQLKLKCGYFDHYVVWKAVITVLQNLSFVKTIYGYENEPLLNRAVLDIFVYYLLNILLITILLYNMCVLFQYRYFWIVNQRLEQIAVEQQKYGYKMRMKHEINSLSNAYLRLLRICSKCTKIYEQQTLLMVAILIAANMLSLFIVKIVWSGKVLETSAWVLFDNLQLVVINVIDFWLTITICELTVNTSRRTSDLLRYFNDLAILPKGEERNLELFAFICGSNQLNFRLCGMIDLSHLTGCNVVSTMILYLIYFVQLDYNDE